MGLCVNVLILLSISISTASKTDFEIKVDKVADYLKQYAKTSLGVDELQKRYDKVSNNPSTKQVDSIVLRKIIDRFSRNTKMAEDALVPLRTAIQHDYEVNINGDTSRTLNDCCDYKKQLKANNFYQTKVNMNDFCEMTFDNKTYCRSNKNTGRSYHLLNGNTAKQNLKKAFDTLKSASPYTYYGAEDGYFIQYPASDSSMVTPCSCVQYDPRKRPWYVSTLTPKEGKDVIIAIDFSKNMMKMEGKMRHVVNVLLDSLDGKDRILIHLYRKGVKYFPLDCARSLTTASPAIIASLRNFISKEQINNIDDSLSYSKVFDDLYSSFKGGSNSKKVIHFITSGFLQDTSSTVNTKIREKSVQLNCSVIVNFIVLSDGTLNHPRRISHEDYLKSACTCSHCTPDRQKMNNLVVFEKQSSNLDLRSIRYSIRPLYNALSKDGADSEIHYSLPYLDFFGQGTLIDACTRCKNKKGEILGVACVTFLSAELLGISTEQSVDSYAFMIDTWGRTFIHPKYAEPVLVNDPSIPLDILNLERADEFKEIYSSMKSGGNGTKSFFKNISIPMGEGNAVGKMKKYTYTWKKVPNSPFSIAVVISNDFVSYIYNLTGLKADSNEMYHRLDIYNQTNNVCLVKNTISIKTKSVFKLPRDVFQKPLSYQDEETLSSITQLTNFMSMKSNVPPNKLKSQDIAYNLRNAIVTSNFLEKEVWMKDSSLGSLYIIWRYFGTEEGVMRTYPGHKYHPYYDPRARPWYIRAKASPDQLIITSPYQDAGTGTILLTLAKAIYKKKVSSGKLVAGVAGLDFSVPYFQSILLQNVDVCNEEVTGQRCLVIDQAGYLIFHKNFLRQKHYNTTHLVELEYYIGDDMLEQGLMKKDYCLGYFNEEGVSESAHVQYFYTLNHVTTSQTRETSDKCLKYILTPITGTNLFVVHVIKNQCSFKTIPCTCNKKKCVVSRPSDMKMCECPCRDYKVCLSDLPASKSNLLCTPPSKIININVTSSSGGKWISEKKKAVMSDCMDHKCYKSTSVLQCDRIGCQWCFKYPNGTHVDDKKKLCNYTGHCFNHLIIRTTRIPTTLTTTVASSTSDGLSGGVIVAIVVGIVVLIVLILVLIYFIRKKLNERDHEIPKLPRPPSPVVIVNTACPDVVQESDWF